MARAWWCEAVMRKGVVLTGVWSGGAATDGRK